MGLAVYEVGSEEGYELCQPLASYDFEKISALINGEQRSANWTPIKVKIFRESNRKALSKSDSPWLGSHALIFRPTALNALRPTLEDHGELLPLDCADGDLSIYNVTHIIDALDYENSSITRFKSGEIMMIMKYIFRAHMLRGVKIFKVENLKASPTFVTKNFVDLWSKNKLKGLAFIEVWRE